MLITTADVDQFWTITLLTFSGSNTIDIICVLSTDYDNKSKYIPLEIFNLKLTHLNINFKIISKRIKLTELIYYLKNLRGLYWNHCPNDANNFNYKCKCKDCSYRVYIKDLIK